MSEQLLAEVADFGSKDLQKHASQAWAELAAGTLVHVVDRKMGRHKAWLVPVLEPGYQAERISCQEFIKKLGTVLDRVRDGEVFEVAHHSGGGRGAVAVVGYVTWCPPDPVARLDTALRFASRRSRSGRTRLRDIMPTEVEARP
jgi:hypothetical protein